MALTIICALIVVLYVIIDPNKPPPGPSQVAGDRFIQIYTASWGENCNSFIEQENLNRQQLRLQQKVANDTADASLKPLPRINSDNVLSVLGARCNGKLDCTFYVTSEELKIEPLASCFKQLVIGYRCFAYDRLWTHTINQGENITIDCHENATPPAP